MTRASKEYIKTIRERFGYLATWLPNASLELGDVGVLEGDAFEHKTSLSSLNIPFTVRRGKSKGDLLATSKSGVSLAFKLAGEVAAGSSLPLAKAGVSMRFEHEGAFLFHALDCRQDEIEDKVSVGKAILALVESGDWNPDWVVVDTLVSARSATIVVSNAAQAVLELAADTPVTETDLARVDAGLSLSSMSGDLTQCIASEDVTPLLKLSRVRTSFIKKLFGASGAITFGGPSAEPSADSASEVEDNPLEEVLPELDERSEA